MADSEDVDSAGSIYVVFGWEKDGDEGEAWGSSVDLTALDGKNGFVVHGSSAGGHFG